MATPALTPPGRDDNARGGIPNIEFIKKHVPIADVARALDIRVASNTAAHCWRHGDLTPSLWFSKQSNKGKCFVCDRFFFSNIDLVQMVLGLSTADAVNWIAQRWNVPRIAKRRPSTNRIVVPSGRVGCGSPVQELMRSGVFAALSHATKVLLFVFIEFADDETRELSYRTLRRITGIGSNRTIGKSIETLQDIGLLKTKHGRGGDGLRATNGYRLTWDDANLRALMEETHETISREIKAEAELQQQARASRAAYLGNTSRHSVNRKKVQPVHSVHHSSRNDRIADGKATNGRSA